MLGAQFHEHGGVGGGGDWGRAQEVKRWWCRKYCLCSQYFSFLFLTVSSGVLWTSALSINHSFIFFDFQETLVICLKPFISNACRGLCAVHLYCVMKNHALTVGPTTFGLVQACEKPVLCLKYVQKTIRQEIWTQSNLWNDWLISSCSSRRLRAACCSRQLLLFVQRHFKMQ